MKYKKNKLRLNETASAMQDFYFLVKFDLVLIYILKLYCKNFSLIYWEKICSIHYLHFSFEKHVHSQVLKDFSVENLETTPSISLSKCSLKIYLSWIINNWSSIFTLYLMWGEFSLVCVLSVFFCFFLLCYLFLSFFFFLTDTSDS